MPPPDCRLGVDVGGTNTDAVIMDAADRVLAKAKVPGISKAEFDKLAEAAEKNCPVSKVLNAKITLNATLE